MGGMFSGVPSGHNSYFTIHQTPCVWLISGCPFGTNQFNSNLNEFVSGMNSFNSEIRSPRWGESEPPNSKGFDTDFTNWREFNSY